MDERYCECCIQPLGVCPRCGLEHKEACTDAWGACCEECWCDPDEDRVLFTTAPEAADYSHATTVERFPDPWGGAKTYRMVRIRVEGATPERLDYLARYQLGRYQSFAIHYASDEDPRDAVTA